MADSQPTIKHTQTAALVLAAGFLAAHSAYAQAPPPTAPPCGPDARAALRAGMTTYLGKTAKEYPAVGQASSAEVGQSMIYQQTSDLMGIVRSVSGPFTVTGVLDKKAFTLLVPDGPLAPKKDTMHLQSPKAEFRYGEKRAALRPEIEFAIDPRRTVVARIGYGSDRTSFPAPQAKLEVDECLTSGASNIRQELVYNGVARGVVSLTYREFAGNLARPAFTQTLTYDLADGKEIGFRGARFRIDEATNLAIKYTVLKPLGTGA